MKHTNEKSPGFNIQVYVSVFAANLITVAMGVAYAWSSPAIPRLNGSINPEGNPLQTPITPTQESWIASLVPLGSIFSVFVAGILCDRIGRKRTLLTAAIPITLGFVLCAFPIDVYSFYFGRLFSGFGCGLAFPVIPIYVGEISEKHNRGLLGCVFTLGLTIGNLLVYVLALYCSIMTLCVLSLAFPVLFVLLFGRFAPETPYYFVMKNQIEQARLSLLKLRYNDSDVVENELPVIRKNIEESISKKRSVSEFVKDKGLRKGLMVTLILAGFQQFSGINIIFFYMQSIFEESKTKLSSDLCTIIVGIVQMSTATIASITIDRFGRKILLITSGIGMTITISILGAYFYLKENLYDVQNWNLVPILFINLYVAMYAIGFGPVVFGIAGEFFPMYAKSVATTLTICCCLTSTFIVTTVFPHLKEAIGIGLTFFGLGAICLIGALFVYFKMPETKGKSLQEVEEMLRK